MNPERPLDGIRTIRTKLGLLVGASVVVAAVVAEVGDAAGVAGWISLPVTVAAALAVTQWLARGMTSPLREMTTAAGAMARGDHGQRVAASSTDEVGELARAFNAMAADLASADQQRRLLVATVSHELRTPLSAQRALLENLVDGVVRPDDEALRAALRQSERLSALVGDLLDLSRIDAGAAPLELTDVVVSELLHDVVAEAGVDGRTVRVRTAVEPPELTVRADPARLHQLVANLVDNAVRHSPQDREVHVVAASVDAATWSLEVCDDGPGIPVDRVDRVFDRFGSGEDAGGGTGLGLAIARWVGELHGGTVTVVPTAPGDTGARVRAVLPRAPKAQRRPGPDEESHTMNAPATTNPTPPPPSPTAPGAARPAGPGPGGGVFDGFWPEKGVPVQPLAVLAALGIGAWAALTWPERNVGLAVCLTHARRRTAHVGRGEVSAQPVDHRVRRARRRARDDDDGPRRGRGGGPGGARRRRGRGRRHHPGPDAPRRAVERRRLAAVGAARAAAPRPHHHRDEQGVEALADPAHRRPLPRGAGPVRWPVRLRATPCSARGPTLSCPTSAGTPSSPAPSCWCSSPGSPSPAPTSR